MAVLMYGRELRRGGHCEKPVSFYSEEPRLVGDVYYPDDVGSGEPREALSCATAISRPTMSWSGVVEDLLIRPRGPPSYAPLVRYRSFQYQAATWDWPRRVIAKVEHHLGELFPRVGFIVTTLTGTNRAVVHFYDQRGTAEQWIKEGKAATHWTRLSCHRFRANEVRLLLGVIAYNPGNLMRRLALPLTIQSWSLTSLQRRLFKTGGRLIRHAGYSSSSWPRTT